MGLLQQIQSGRTQMPPRIMTYGTEGIGKSTLAAGTPRPIFVQTEDGLGEIDCDKFPLPPGLPCVANDDDEACLRLYLDAIRQAEAMDRQAVRSNASAEFATSSILSELIAAFDEARTFARGQ